MIRSLTKLDGAELALHPSLLERRRYVERVTATIRRVIRKVTAGKVAHPSHRLSGAASAFCPKAVRIEYAKNQARVRAILYTRGPNERPNILQGGGGGLQGGYASLRG